MLLSVADKRRDDKKFFAESFSSAKTEIICITMQIPQKPDINETARIFQRLSSFENEIIPNVTSNNPNNRPDILFVALGKKAAKTEKIITQEHIIDIVAQVFLTDKTKALAYVIL